MYRILLPFFVAVVLLTACAVPEPLSYKGISGVTVEPVSMSTTNLNFIVLVNNPNKYDLVVKQVDATLLVNKKQAGTYNTDSTMRIPGKADYSFPATIKVNNGVILTGAMSFLTSGRIPYAITGKARAGRKKWQATIPFTYDGLLDLNEILSKKPPTGR